MPDDITLADVERARATFDSDIVQRTPVDRSRSLGAVADAEVSIKMEHLQRTGSFKTRGASYKMHRLCQRDDPVERVVAASAGNHAQGVALAAADADIPATIVMPEDAPQTKIDATRDYGAEVLLHGTEFQAAVDRMTELGAEPGTEVVHAYDDPDIVTGQGTVALELLEDVPDVDTVVVPVGGGGLIAGIGTVLAERAPDVRLVGVQADSAATVPQSLQKGRPYEREETDTIADGIATGSISALTYDYIDRHVDEVVTVSDDDISNAVLFLLERTKQVVEGAGAASVAPLLTGDLDVAGETVVPVLSGGNLDMSMLGTVLDHELTTRDRLLQLRIRIDDRPGVLTEVSGIVADYNANVRTVHHYRANEDLHVGEAYLTFEVETSGREHAQQIRETIEAAGYSVVKIN